MDFVVNQGIFSFPLTFHHYSLTTSLPLSYIFIKLCFGFWEELLILMTLISFFLSVVKFLFLQSILCNVFVLILFNWKLSCTSTVWPLIHETSLCLDLGLVVFVHGFGLKYDFSSIKTSIAGQLSLIILLYRSREREIIFPQMRVHLK